MAGLVRSLNFYQLTFYGIGTMVGAGIYVLVGKVAGISGYVSLYAFLFAAWVVAFSAFSYGQLAAHYPRAGGAALYIQEAFKVNWLAQLTGAGVLMTGIVSAATLINGFYGYVQEFIGLPLVMHHGLVALLLLWVATRKVADSVNVVVVITILELLGLVVVIAATPSDPALTEKIVYTIPAGNDWAFILAGAFVAFYAFIGFEDLVNMAEEAKNPRSTMKLAMTASLVVTTVLYVLVTWVALGALPLDTLAASDAPFADMLALTSPELAKAVSVISLIAISNGALVQILMGARLTYGMSEQGLLPDWFSKLSANQIPVRATWVITGIIFVFSILLPLLTLAKITSSLILVLFALVNLAAVIVLRREGVAAWRWILSLVGCISSLGLLFG